MNLGVKVTSMFFRMFRGVTAGGIVGLTTHRDQRWMG